MPNLDLAHLLHVVAYLLLLLAAEEVATDELVRELSLTEVLQSQHQETGERNTGVTFNI